MKGRRAASTAQRVSARRKGQQAARAGQGLGRRQEESLRARTPPTLLHAGGKPRKPPEGRHSVAAAGGRGCGAQRSRRLSECSVSAHRRTTGSLETGTREVRGPSEASRRVAGRDLSAERPAGETASRRRAGRAGAWGGARRGRERRAGEGREGDRPRRPFPSADSAWWKQLVTGRGRVREGRLVTPTPAGQGREGPTPPLFRRASLRPASQQRQVGPPRPQRVLGGRKEAPGGPRWPLPAPPALGQLGQRGPRRGHASPGTLCPCQTPGPSQCLLPAFLGLPAWPFSSSPGSRLTHCACLRFPSEQGLPPGLCEGSWCR